LIAWSGESELKRRKFVKSVIQSAAAISLFDFSISCGAKRDGAISITIDDPNLFDRPLIPPVERNEAILSALRGHGDLKAALFVCGKHIDTAPGRVLLDSWDSEGHLLGNHTYSHRNLSSSKVDADEYIRDIERCHDIVSGFDNFSGLFRFPFLKEGDTVDKRDTIRSFLKSRGYKTGHVTIDTSDWYIEQRMRNRLENDLTADLSPYKQYYIDHILRQAALYDDLSMKVLGRSVKHTLLIHHSILTALFLGDLLIALEDAGWRLVDAADAFEDEVFSREPDIIPAGDSIIMALAREKGGLDEYVRYPGEDGEYEKERMDKLGL